MEYLLVKLVALPLLLRYGVFLLLCTLLGIFTGRLFKRRRAIIFFTMGYLALTLIITTTFNSTFRQWLTTGTTIESVEHFRFFKLLFDRHPESKKDLHEKLKQLIKLELGDEKANKAVDAMLQDTIKQYLPLYLAAAPDNALYDMLRTDLDNLKILKIEPEACVKYYLGAPYLESKNTLLMLMFVTQTNARADVIEAADNTPSTAFSPVSPEEMVHTLAETYKHLGYDPKSLADIGTINTMKPKDACEAATHFFAALVELPPDKASAIYKSLLALQANSNLSTGE